MKYKITNKKNKVLKTVEARKRPTTFAHGMNRFVKRIREKVETITNNQKHRANRKMRILDDRGREHKEGEIFESQTLTIET